MNREKKYMIELQTLKIAHNDEIKILKDKFSSQVTQIKETFKKLMDKEKTL